MNPGCLTGPVIHLYNLVTHGREFLTEEEFEDCLHRRISEYYNFLAVSLVRGRRDKKFWDYHKRKLTEAGVGFSRLHLVGTMLARSCEAALSPYETMRKLREGRNLTVGQVGKRNRGHKTIPGPRQPAPIAMKTRGAEGGRYSDGTEN